MSWTRLGKRRRAHDSSSSSHPLVLESHRPHPRLPKIPVRLHLPVVHVFPPPRLLRQAPRITPQHTSPPPPSALTQEDTHARPPLGRAPRLGHRRLDLRPLVPLVPARHANHLRVSRDCVPPLAVVVLAVLSLLRRCAVPRPNRNVRVPAAVKAPGERTASVETTSVQGSRGP